MVETLAAGGGLALVVLVVLIAFGLLECFFGYKLFKVILGIVGFLLGAGLGAAAGFGLSDGNVPATIIAAILGGALGSALLVLLYFVGVFVLGAGLGFALGTAAASLLRLGEGTVPLVISIVLAIILGVLAVIFQKVMIILSTAFGGSWIVVSAVASLVGGVPLAAGVNSLAADIGALVRGGGLGAGGLPDLSALLPVFFSTNLPMLVGWAILGLLGAIVQFRRRD